MSITAIGSLEHYYNSAIQGDKNFSLADLGLTYVNGGVRYSLDWTNIFNTEKYVSASYGALNSYYSEYGIQPFRLMPNGSEMSIATRCVSDCIGSKL